MINDILKGVVNAIRTEFGEDCNIYTEKVEQGLKEPCFFIFALNPQIKQVLSKRYLLDCMVVVQYMHDKGNFNFNEVGEKLFSVLELIDVSGDLVMGRDMSYTIEQNVMTFNVAYSIYFYKLKDQIYMEDIEQETEV